MAARLDEVDLDKKLADKKDYEKQLRKWQLRLLNLEQSLRNSSHGVLIAFEGWDASGKGGAIKRLIEALDPRGYKVFSICAPTDEEKRHHYLWRFWNRIPACGELVIFDRSWYGRVLVERVEGFATEEEWHRAYQEINCFEEQLVANRTLLLKFWLQISADEQFKRFKEREDNPLKRWKITPEDWRNREKRSHYEKAAEEMLKRTDTEHAPWRIISGEHKWYARVDVLRHTVQALEDVLGKHAAQEPEPLDATAPK